MVSAKQSFEVDILSGFKVIHLDPSINFDGTLNVERALERLFELYEFCWGVAQKYNKEIIFEIGTEEQSGSTNCASELIYTLDRVTSFCLKNDIPKPTFVVVQTGTRVLETRNVGSFSSSLRVRGELAPEIQIYQMTEICNRYGVMIKQHNTDYLPTNDLCWMPKLNIHSANVAPEFGVAETKSIINFMDCYNLKELKDRFLEIAFNSGKWEKWMTLGTTATDFDRAKVVFKTNYAGNGPGKLYFYTLSGGNAAQAIFNVANDNSNNTTFQTVDIDLTTAPATGTYANDIARIGFRTPWGISSGDVCQVQRIELYNQPPPLHYKIIHKHRYHFH